MFRVLEPLRQRVSYAVVMQKRSHRSSPAGSIARSSKSVKYESFIDPRRIRSLNSIPNSTSNKPVLYWMTRDLRVEDNWAMIHAMNEARKTNSAIGVVFNLVDRYLDATSRQFAFQVRGLHLMESKLAEMKIPFLLLQGQPETNVTKLANDIEARLLVVDYSPLCIEREWRQKVANEIRCTFSEVDAHNIVPVWVASNKREHAAYTIRPRINSLLPEFLTEFPKLDPVEFQDSIPSFQSEIDWDGVLEQVLKRNEEVPEIHWLQSGEAAGREALDEFLKPERFSLYASSRNNPTLPEAQSGLSPYLHFGFLAPQRAALEAQKHEHQFKDSVNQFLEELIIRRELSDNFCHYELQYDSFEAAASWAKQTLQQHANDHRPFLYTKEEFENAATHEDLWNACQKELVHGGKLHGYMRMYWAKKILEWSASPEEALAISIYLNDKYSLDGCDPNGYIGCQWSITGIHDHGFKERPILGKIRPMTYNGCKRKFDVKAYIARVDEIAKRATKSGV